MHTWIELGIFATFLWAITIHIDKYLVSKLFKESGVGALMIFSSLITGIIMSPLFYILSKGKVGMDLSSILWIYGASFFYIFATWIYFKALEIDDASTIIAVFQTIPVFSYFIGLIFLNEVLTLKQIFACAIIVLASVLITINFSDIDINKGKYKALIFMLISSLSFSLSFFLFKFVTKDTTFYVTAFWEQLGFLVNGILMMIFIKGFRNDFIDLISTNGKMVIELNVLNEFINLVAKIIYNFVSINVPLAILWSLNEPQPFFVFLIGLVLAMLLPNIINEDINKRIVIKKISCMVLSLIGLLMLYF